MRYTERELKTEYSTFSEYVNSIFELLIFSPFRLINEISKKVVFLEKSRIEKLFLTTIGISLIIVVLECIINFALRTLNIFTGKFPIIFQIICIAIIIFLYGFIRNYKSSIPPEIEALLYNETGELGEDSEKKADTNKSIFTKMPFNFDGVKNTTLNFNETEKDGVEEQNVFKNSDDFTDFMSFENGDSIEHSFTDEIGEESIKHGFTNETENEHTEKTKEEEEKEENKIKVGKEFENFDSLLDDLDDIENPNADVESIFTNDLDDDIQVDDDLDQYDCAENSVEEFINPEIINNQEVIAYKTAHKKTVEFLKAKDNVPQKDALFTNEEIKIIQKMCDNAIKESKFFDDDVIEIALKNQEYDNFSQVDNFLEDDDVDWVEQIQNGGKK